MSNLRRYFAEGQTYFVTAVTYQRRPILVDNASLLLEAIRYSRSRFQFDLQAFVILPDHFHLMIRPIDASLSRVMKCIKQRFAGQFKSAKNIRGRLWQHRFWDHVIRDDRDWKKHMNYIHFNPVKHGFVDDPFQWTHSSIHKAMNAGDSVKVDKRQEFEGEFGE